MVKVLKIKIKKKNVFFLAQLKSLCQDLHNQLKTNEDTRYDLEFKIRKQDYDVRNQ